MRGWKCRAVKGILRFWELVETTLWLTLESNVLRTYIVQLEDPGTGLKRALTGCRKILVLLIGSGHSIVQSPPDSVLDFRKKNNSCEFKKNETSQIKDVDKKCKKWGASWRDFGGSEFFLFTFICLVSFFKLLLLLFFFFFLIICLSQKSSTQLRRKFFCALITKIQSQFLLVFTCQHWLVFCGRSLWFLFFLS